MGGSRFPHTACGLLGGRGEGVAPIWWGEAPERLQGVRGAIGILPDEDYCYTLTRAEPCPSAGSRLGSLTGLPTISGRMRQPPWSNFVVARSLAPPN